MGVMADRLATMVVKATSPDGQIEGVDQVPEPGPGLGQLVGCRGVGVALGPAAQLAGQVVARVGVLDVAGPGRGEQVLEGGVGVGRGQLGQPEDGLVGADQHVLDRCRGLEEHDVQRLVGHDGENYRARPPDGRRFADVFKADRVGFRRDLPGR